MIRIVVFTVDRSVAGSAFCLEYGCSMRLSRRTVPFLCTVATAAVGLVISLPSATANPAASSLPGDSGWKTTIERTAPTDEASSSITGPFRLRFGFADERAALQALQFALNEVGDGSTFVWHRKKGVLSGKIRPTAVFVDDNERLCRHLVFSLSAGDRTSTIEGIACRTESGLWKL